MNFDLQLRYMNLTSKIHFQKAHPLRLMLILLIFVMIGVSPVFAQGASEISISSPDMSQYPQISLSMRVSDQNGTFIKDLQAGDIDIVENGSRLSASSLNLENTGVRFFVAVNEGPTLANRYSGASRFERIKAALFTWIATHESKTLDEFRLFTNQGPLDFSSTNSVEWQAAVEAYNPDLRNMQPSLSSLTGVVNETVSTDTQSKKPVVILFITPLPHPSQFTAIKELFTQAEKSGVRIFVWLVGPVNYSVSPDALMLKEYAEQTGGNSILFSGSEDLPSITSMLDPFEYQYQLSYKTSLNISGDYSIAVRVIKDELTLESEPVPFTLQVSPPNPFFLSPPVEITRSWTEARRRRDSVLSPDIVNIKIMVEFPDGKSRDLAYSRLFVDNSLADENTLAPFDEFSWDISGITTSGSHVMQVIVEDIAGLKGETIEIPVDVIVNEQPMSLLQRIFAQINIVNGIIGATIVLLVIGGLIALIRAVRRRTHKLTQKSSFDPVTQPVEINGEYSLEPSKVEQKLEWPIMRGVGLAPARLIVKPGSTLAESQPTEIPLGGGEITVGSERRKVDVVLVHPTVSAVHARIFKDAEGNFRVADAGSSAGTWVNYAPVSSHGAHLEHGDLVQFGRIAYVFEVHGAIPKRAQVLPYQED